MSDQSIYLFGHYSLDLGRGCLTRNGIPVHLRRQTYEVLKLLVENRGHLISKDRLIEEVWQGRAVTDGSLGKCIEEVREALGEDARKYVRNERGRGYIFDPDTSESPSRETDQQRLIPSSVVAENARRGMTPFSIGSSRQVRTRILSTVLALSVLALVVVVAVILYARYASRSSQQIDSVAVLPFINGSGEANAQYMSDGLSERLIDELAKLPNIKVIGRTSSFTYKGDVDVREVARALRVRAVVTGRVVQRGDNILVSAELVDAKDRSRLWGGQYTRQIGDLQQLQEEIAVGLTDELQQRLSGTSKQQEVKHLTVNSQAYQFYLNGLFHFHQGSNESDRKALEYFNQAALLDPNFALAWAMVSRANNLLGGNSVLNPKDTQVKAKAAAERALELDEELADAHLALGRIKQDQWDWAGAEQAYKRAIQLSPSLVVAHTEYSQFLSIMQRHNEAVNENKRAQELDPMSVRLRRQETWVLNLARRHEEALQLSLEIQKQDQPTAGNHRSLGFTYAAMGKYEQAIQEFRRAISIDGEGTGNLCYLAAALAGAGKKQEALEIVGKLRRRKDYVSPTELAGVYAVLNDRDEAMKLLEVAYAERDVQLQHLNIDYHFDSLRSDPQFEDLVRRVGLPSKSLK